MKKFLKSNKSVAIFAIFLFELIISIIVTPDRYDSAFFIEQMKEVPIFDFLSMRYQTWTSRVIIEFVVCTVLTHNRLVWSILNTGMMTLIAYSILKLFVKGDDKKITFISMFLILLYPIEKIAATCDWGAGTMNYTWPLAMLLFAIIPLKKIISGEKVKWYLYPVYSLAMIFACNQEQVCAIAFGIYFIFTVLYILKNKKVHPFLIVQCILIILSLVFIATCPGNYERKTVEIEEYFMEYNSFGVLDKISLGFVATSGELLINNNIVLLVFTVVCATYIIISYKNTLYRVIALIPLILSLMFGALYNVSCGLFPYFAMFTENCYYNPSILTAGNYTYYINFMPLIISLVLFGSIFLNILLIFKNLKNNVAIVIYLLGLASRLILGFSPTVFASTERTFMFFEFALIIISILILQEFAKQDDKISVKAMIRLEIFIKILSVMECINTFLYSLTSQL